MSVKCAIIASKMGQKGHLKVPQQLLKGLPIKKATRFTVSDHDPMMYIK